MPTSPVLMGGSGNPGGWTGYGDASDDEASVLRARVGETASVDLKVVRLLDGPGRSFPSSSPCR